MDDGDDLKICQKVSKRSKLASNIYFPIIGNKGVLKQTQSRENLGKGES